jgi:hypothetical protein
MVGAGREEVGAEIRGHCAAGDCLRMALEPDDQIILTLRVDRARSWRDIAAVMAGEGAPDTEIARKSALLRKRFERLNARLRDLVSGEHHA